MDGSQNASIIGSAGQRIAISMSESAKSGAGKHIAEMITRHGRDGLPSRGKNSSNGSTNAHVNQARIKEGLKVRMKARLKE